MTLRGQEDTADQGAVPGSRVGLRVSTGVSQVAEEALAVQALACGCPVAIALRVDAEIDGVFR
jgi:hypothetical protein